MAKEKNLTTVTSVAAADFARLVTSAGASVKATAANLAKYIIETYNGSTVAGSAQSVKSALDSLNSKITVVTVTDIAVNSGYVQVSNPAGYDANDIFIVQPSYSGTSQTGGWTATVQPQASKVNIYIRTGTGARPADGTLITFTIIAIKSS